MNKLELFDEIRNINGRLQYLSKQITSMSVPGLLLTREDLGVRFPKKKKMVHGQKHQSTGRKNVTTPDLKTGQGTYPHTLHPNNIPN